MTVAAKAFRVEFEVLDPTRKRLVTVSHRGRLFNAQGKQVLLFPVRIFAQAIDRAWSTLKRWEVEGKMPKAMYEVKGHRCKRWYSANQIKFANDVWKRHRQKNRHFDQESFFKEIREKFYLLDLGEEAAS